MSRKNVRLGIIGSSGGGALSASMDCLRKAGKSVDLFIVCDRDCGMLDWAKDNGLCSTLIEYRDAKNFSRKSLEWFRKHGVTNILLFYTRLVTYPLIDNIEVYNVHPSLLPSFKGINAVGMALEAGVRVLGATLHQVDEGLDTGPIVAQIATGLPTGIDITTANKMSYLQKVYLTLLWYELIYSNKMDRDSILLSTTIDISAFPIIISPELRSAFELLQNKENQYVI